MLSRARVCSTSASRPSRQACSAGRSMPSRGGQRVVPRTLGMMRGDDPHQMLRQLPAIGEHGPGRGMVESEGLPLHRVQRRIPGRRRLQHRRIGLRYRMREHGLAEIVQQAGHEGLAVVPVVAEGAGQALRQASGQHRVQQKAAGREGSEHPARQVVHRRHADGEILDRIHAQVDQGVLDRGHVAGQREIGGIDQLQDVHRHHRIAADRLHQILGRAVDVGGQPHQPEGALRKRRHPIHHGEQPVIVDGLGHMRGCGHCGHPSMCIGSTPS